MQKDNRQQNVQLLNKVSPHSPMHASVQKKEKYVGFFLLLLPEVDAVYFENWQGNFIV